MYQILDIYSIFHLIYYFIYGFYFKIKYVLIFILGILWEIFEYVLANINYTKEYLIKNWQISYKYWADKNIFNKVFDLIFNMLGYHLGNISKFKLFKK